ncbi:guanylate kinase [Aridibaculum aurantiacum]|uniref:guanylate kinase n=1 Tax=Aridibaculum aurantiacum TaxID=2810307 RepID=UPI001A972ABB|nr:guanylate kinase [Aridibaculum aurantiacum]
MKGKIIVITAPSGAGKTSITRYLLQKYDQLAFSISAATRLPRGKEKNGVDYYFMTVEEFQERIHRNEFMEWEMVYEGKYYGTLKTEMERLWSQGKAVILDIDVKGAIHIQKQYPENTISLFIEPPSIDELRNRLEGRGVDDEETIKTRLNKASYELSFKHSFDRVITNHNLETACKEAEEIIIEFLNK